MDSASIFGVIFGLIMVVTGIFLGGGTATAYIDAPSILIVIGGSFASVIAANSTTNLRNLGSVFRVAFKNDAANPIDYVVSLVSFSEKARREGLLSLEDEIDNINDEFLKAGMRLVIDGAEPNIVKTILNAEITSIDSRHSTGAKMVEDLGSFAPAFGMIGTLIGLIIMLRSMGGDPTAVGKGMAAALITTFYGAVLANCIFLPVTSKLEKLNVQEIDVKSLIIEGILSIQAGDNPKTLQTKLLSFFSQKQREIIMTRLEGGS